MADVEKPSESGDSPNPRTRGLTPWHKGQSGNPGGRPKGRSLSSAVRGRLGEIAPEAIVAKLGLPTESTWRDVLVETTMRAAVADDAQARRLLFEYHDGAPTQSVDMTHHRSDERTTEELLARLDELRAKELTDADAE
jgi:hypothetical protein